MRVKKIRWIIVNYSTGEICQVGKPTTKRKAHKHMIEYYGRNSEEWTWYEKWSDIKPIV